MALAVQQASIENVRMRMQASLEAFALSPNGVEVVQVVVAPDGTIVGCNARIVGH